MVKTKSGVAARQRGGAPPVAGWWRTAGAPSCARRALALLPAQERDPAFATLCVAVFDGLFLELMSTGDRKRTTQAIDRFIRIVGDARATRADA